MSPKVKSSGMITRSRKKSMPQIQKTAPKKSTLKTTSSKPRTVQKTPKNKKKAVPVSSASPTVNSSSTPIEEVKKSKKDDILITPKLMKYSLSAYKQSPEYKNLKKKRFNTSFSYNSPRGYRDIEIFTPEENNSPKWNENVPFIEDRIQSHEPGEKYADIFLSIPGISDSDEDKGEKASQLGKAKRKSVGKRGRKKSIGYNGTPLPDECLLTDYTSLLYSSD